MEKDKIILGKDLAVGNHIFVYHNERMIIRKARLESITGEGSHDLKTGTYPVLALGFFIEGMGPGRALIKLDESGDKRAYADFSVFTNKKSAIEYHNSVIDVKVDDLEKDIKGLIRNKIKQ